MTRENAPGWFIVFEGGDGVGKSTQVELLTQSLSDAGVPFVVTYEPGDTKLGDRIRDFLLDPESGDIAPRAEALLYAADKSQHLHEIVFPALRAGKVVVCDRYLDSMLAYQGAGRVLDRDEVACIAEWATGGLAADLTILLDLDPSQAVAMKESKDRLEQAGADFHMRVREGFLELASAQPENYLVLPARQGREQIAQSIRARLAEIGVPKISA